MTALITVENLSITRSGNTVLEGFPQLSTGKYHIVGPRLRNRLLKRYGNCPAKAGQPCGVALVLPNLAYHLRERRSVSPAILTPP